MSKLDTKTCPRCFRTGDSIGHCGNHTVGCPTPRSINPATDVVASCALCDIIVAVPIEKIMQGKLRPVTGRCKADHCKAVIIPVPKSTKGKGGNDSTAEG